MNSTSTSVYGNDHREWLNAIEFYKKEFEILESRLAEIVSKNTGSEAMAGAEHFQNQFIIQRNNMDELRHNINEHVQHAHQHAGLIETAFTGEHSQVKDEFISFEKVVKDLRKEFNDYLAKWM